jgi:hypothetical protein
VSGITNIGGGGNSNEGEGIGSGVGDKLGVGDDDGGCGEGETNGNVQPIVAETRQPIVVSTINMRNNGRYLIIPIYLRLLSLSIT